MSLVNRRLTAALADSATITAQDAATPTEITVRRLPGSPHWEVLVDGVKSLATASHAGAAEEALASVAQAPGGRATVIFDDQDSLTERMARQKRGEKVVSHVSIGDRYWVRWSIEDQAYTPAKPGEGVLALGVQRVGWDPETNLYMHHSGLLSTRPLEAHDIVTLVRDA